MQRYKFQIKLGSKDSHAVELDCPSDGDAMKQADHICEDIACLASSDAVVVEVRDRHLKLLGRVTTRGATNSEQN